MDTNRFFRQLTLKICGSLDIKEALTSGLAYLSTAIPADGLTFDISYRDDACLSIARVDHHGADISDIRIPLSAESQAEVRENAKREGVMIFNAPDMNAVSLDFARELGTARASHLVLGLSLGPGLERDYHGGIAIYAFGDHRYTQAHADLLALVREPFSIAMTNALKHRELERRSQRVQEENQGLYRELMQAVGDRVIGAEAGLKPAMDQIKQVAAVDSPVLLLGETGVGKEVTANALHLLSKRREGPMVRVNCGAIPGSLMDSELFGHEKGSFTGASALKRGKFERAHNGTLFLDEVGELSLEAQVRLLRAIQFKEIERVGGTRPVPADARIIAATHRDLEAAVRNGTFRMDLFYRLNVFPVSLPPLRERPGDIPALVQHLLGAKAGELKRPVPKIAPGEIDRLRSYDWPGNVRELSNIIERSLILHTSGPLRFQGALQPGPPAQGPGLETLDLALTRHIQKALNLSKGKIQGPAGAADLLGIHPNTLRSKMKKLGIPFPGMGKAFF
ncbi:MAG: sigma-54 dependent transcriptional regulator [Desulfobacterales bacterium]|nr:sigma-54 dependent transcriptional regulator [Desulfobacterales bacterium]